MCFEGNLGRPCVGGMARRPVGGMESDKEQPFLKPTSLTDRTEARTLRCNCFSPCEMGLVMPLQGQTSPVELGYNEIASYLL